MAFTVLDPDAPQANANSYASVAEFETFHTDRNVTVVVDSEYDPTEIQGALVAATDYIDKRFGRKFRGYKRSRAQRLEWPRIDAFDNDQYTLPGRPEQLLGATVEYALLVLQLGRNLAPPVGLAFPIIDPATGETAVAGGGALSRKTTKVGPIEDTEEYSSSVITRHRPMVSSGSALTQSIPEYPQADLWLEELLTSNISRRLVRG